MASQRKQIEINENDVQVVCVAGAADVLKASFQIHMKFNLKAESILTNTQLTLTDYGSYYYYFYGYYKTRSKYNRDRNECNLT